jgi:hypothetical protein
VWRFEGRVVFVPEGQADSSQAGRALGIDAERPRRGGTVEVTVSPTDFCRRRGPAPKGLKSLAQGFNPGGPSNKAIRPHKAQECAFEENTRSAGLEVLKGRESTFG